VGWAVDWKVLSNLAHVHQCIQKHFLDRISQMMEAMNCFTCASDFM
jgi:hypothetical protein